MRNTPQSSIEPQHLTINLTEIPALLDAHGVRKHLAPLGRTLLYELASQGEIQTASVGMKRGKRVFVTSSIVQWIEKRMAMTKRPKMGSSKA